MYLDIQIYAYLNRPSLFGIKMNQSIIIYGSHCRGQYKTNVKGTIVYGTQYHVDPVMFDGF